MSATQRGSLYVIAACMVWSCGTVAMKFYLNYLPAIPTAVINALLASAIVFLFQPTLKSDVIAAWRRAPRKFLWFGLTGVGFGAVGYNLALVHMPVSVAISLVRLQPLFILFLAAVWLKEKLQGSQFIFIIAALCGTVFVLWPQLLPLFSQDQKMDFWPLLFMAVSILGYATVSVQGKALSNDGYRPAVLIILRFGLGGLICLPLLCLTPIADYAAPWWAWALVPCGAAFSTALGFMLYYRGLPYISASLAAFVEQASPLFTIILGTIILHEKLFTVQYIGAAVLVISMGMLGWLEHRARLIDEIVPEK